MTSPLTHATLLRRLSRTRRGGNAWQRGMAAEEAACAALVRDGWTILLRRARTPSGEIDIVTEKLEPGREALLSFIEVKARPVMSQAAASVSGRQQERLIAAAEILLSRHPEWSHGCIRFDVLLVDAAGMVRRISDAFRQMDPS